MAPVFTSTVGLTLTRSCNTTGKAYINERIEVVTKHFPNAIGMDDFLFRTEVMLRRFGFTADNSIALTSLCRDEITFPLKNAIHDIFGYSMDIDGLGGVISAGTTGLGLGFRTHLLTSPLGENGTSCSRCRILRLMQKERLDR